MKNSLNLSLELLSENVLNENIIVGFNIYYGNTPTLILRKSILRLKSFAEDPSLRSVVWHPSLPSSAEHPIPFIIMGLYDNVNFPGPIILLTPPKLP